ncbi:14618_t:CDS:2, partial [Funneliformis mosseae]
ETPLEENPEDTDLKFRYDLLSADHEHLKKLLTQYSSLLSQKHDIKFVCSLLKNSVMDSERLRRRIKFLYDQLIENGELYNFNVELKPPHDESTGDESSQFL